MSARSAIYSSFAGRWHTPIEIGTSVYKDPAMAHKWIDVLVDDMDAIRSVASAALLALTGLDRSNLSGRAIGQ
ncbi:hypothetical protein [Bradyrhizobium sp. USDA 10063]